MTDEWIERRLRDVTTKIGSGATPLGGEKAYKPEGISLIRSLNVHDSGFRVKDLAFIDETQAAKLDNAEVIAGDVLLNITGASIARCCLTPKDLLPARVNQHVSILRPVQSELLPELLHYMLISSLYKDRLLHAGEGGATRQALTKAQLQEFVIYFPKSLVEQRRFVGILDEAFAGIAVAKRNAEQNVQNARAIFESHLQAIFTQRGDGWVETQLGSICRFENGDRGTNYPSKAHRTSSGIPFINAGHLTDDGIDLASMDYISRDRFNLLSNGKIRPSDILFCLRGSLGKFASTGDLTEGAIASSLVIVRCQPEISEGFLLAYFGSHLCAQMIEDFKNGAAQPNLSAKSLKNFRIPLPPRTIQEVIVQELIALRTETNRLAAIYQQKLTALDELKKSLLARAFAGELTSAAVA